MRPSGSRLRFTVLTAVGALGLHGLRSETELGRHVGGDLAQQAHGYLAALTFVVGVLAVVALAHLLARIAIASRSSEVVRGPGDVLRFWRLASVGLLCMCFGQELLESVIATGRPVDLADMLAHGGWTSLPLIVAVGGVVALATRGCEIAIELAARRGRPAAVPGRLAEPRPSPRPGHPRLPKPIADLAAGRGPPLLAISH